MPRILQLRQRIVAMSAPRFFFNFWPHFSRETDCFVIAVVNYHYLYYYRYRHCYRCR